MRWVVVGAGSAGCVAARRLHDAGHHVIVVETGPALARGAVPPSIDGADSFAAIAEPGRSYADLPATRIEGTAPSQYLRGRGVGGSSAINSMVALDGDLELYSSWGWDDMGEMRSRVLVPSAPAEHHELGRVDVMLLGGDHAVAHRSVALSLTRQGGRRVTTAESYLWPIQGSDRFELLPDHRVSRVLVDNSGAATGVALANGTVIDADRVVVAAGAIHSPALLLRSGIGSEAVGQGIQDHPSVALTLEFDAERSKHGSELGLSTASCVDLDPVQILALNHLGAAAPPQLGALLIALMRPAASSGSVQLGSDDPDAVPLIAFRLLDDAADRLAMRAGVRSAIDLVDELRTSHEVTGAFIDDRGTTIDRLDSDAAIDEWVLGHGADYVHASTSCAGALSDNGALVGHDGVFVCDASAFPSIPNANTHMPTMMLAERFAAGWTDRR